MRKERIFHHYYSIFFGAHSHLPLLHLDMFVCFFCFHLDRRHGIGSGRPISRYRWFHFWWCDGKWRSCVEFPWLVPISSRLSFRKLTDTHPFVRVPHFNQRTIVAQPLLELCSKFFSLPFYLPSQLLSDIPVPFHWRMSFGCSFVRLSTTFPFWVSNFGSFKWFEWSKTFFQDSFPHCTVSFLSNKGLISAER